MVDHVCPLPLLCLFLIGSIYSIDMNSTDVLELRRRLKELKTTWAENDDAFFLCSMAVIIFLMQCGFAFLEAGAVRSKNTTNILIKNLMDSSIAIIGYWSLGWAFAHGDPLNETLGLFIGQNQFFLSGLTAYSKFFFQYVFAATAATIVSGAVAERCEFACFITYCTIISTFVYPILTHWGWTSSGWMAKGVDFGTFKVAYIVRIFAGSGMVHLCGGTISFIGAYLIGSRIGRFDKGGEPKEIKGHSVPFAALGGFILIFGFLAFNGGSVGSISNPGDGLKVGLAMVNTILCGAWAAVTFLAIHFVTQGKWTLLLTLNACLTGCVAACAACDKMQTWGSIVTGSGAGIVYLLLCRLIWRIDDPLDAFAVHFGGGIWGLLSAVIIGPDGVLYGFVQALYGEPIKFGQSVAQFSWQLICAVAIITWSVLWMWPCFKFLDRIGKFRVSREVEIKGLDIFKHGEAAYPIEAYGHGWTEFESVKVDPDGTTEKTTVKAANGTDVVYVNPQRYEHPEHWRRNGLPKRIA